MKNWKEFRRGVSFLHGATKKKRYLSEIRYHKCITKIKETKKVSKLLIIVSFLSISIAAQAQYHKILPKGVRTIINKNISSEISSTINQSGETSPIKYKVKADIEALESIDNADLQAVLGELRPFRDAYEQISLGTHQVDGKADVNVNVFALGWGLTDRLMAYVGLPIYDAKVRLRYKRVEGSSQAEVAAILQDTPNSGQAQTIGAVVEKLYDIDGGIIQSGITNTLGYNELGDWEGKGLGDIEFGLAYVLFQNDYHGLKLTLGGVAPTGYVDDPDTLQDIGFGNGQWDAFAELGGSYSFTDNTYVDLWGRFTYQFSSEKRLRVPIAQGVGISAESQDVEEKLGNKFLVGVGVGHYFTDWFAVLPSLTYEYVEGATYFSENSRANDLLAYNTDSAAQNVKIIASFTSTRLYTQNKFLLPGEINLSYQTLIGGFNIPKSDLLELEFRLFF